MTVVKGFLVTDHHHACVWLDATGKLYEKEFPAEALELVQ
jgi:hypothetical protein